MLANVSSEIKSMLHLSATVPSEIKIMHHYPRMSQAKSILCLICHECLKQSQYFARSGGAPGRTRMATAHKTCQKCKSDPGYTPDTTGQKTWKPPEPGSQSKSDQGSVSFFTNVSSETKNLFHFSPMFTNVSSEINIMLHWSTNVPSEIKIMHH